MMRKWMLLLFMLMTPLVAGATAVTGTVTDAGSQAWANGTWAIQVVPPPGSGPQPALNQNGTLNGSGVFTATITATSSLAPSGAKWQLTVCPQATADCYISFPVITGTTQSLTVTPPAILVNVQSGPVLLYQDNEFANPTIGQFYYNLTSSVYRSWNGSAWMSITPGGGGGTITSCSTAGGVAYENGTNNTLTCGSNFIYSSANKAVDINNGSTTTAQGTLSVRGTGSGDCDNFMGPCLLNLYSEDDSGYEVMLRAKTGDAAGAVGFVTLDGSNEQVSIGAFDTIHNITSVTIDPLNGALFFFTNGAEAFRLDVTKQATFSGNISLALQHPLIFSDTNTPTISSGFGTGAAIVSSNGPAAFRISVGTSNTGTGIIGLPAATTGWNCYVTDITTTSTTVSQTKQKATGSDTTHVAVQNYTDVSATGAWVDNDVLAVSCFAF